MDGISKLIATFSDLLSQLLPLLVSIGVIYFIWGVVRYVIADDEDNGDETKETEETI